jgi:DNA primase
MKTDLPQQNKLIYSLWSRSFVTGVPDTNNLSLPTHFFIKEKKPLLKRMILSKNKDYTLEKCLELLSIYEESNEAWEKCPQDKTLSEPTNSSPRDDIFPTEKNPRKNAPLEKEQPYTRKVGVHILHNLLLDYQRSSQSDAIFDAKNQTFSLGITDTTHHLLRLYEQCNQKQAHRQYVYISQIEFILELRAERSSLTRLGALKDKTMLADFSSDKSNVSQHITPTEGILCGLATSFLGTPDPMAGRKIGSGSNLTRTHKDDPLYYSEYYDGSNNNQSSFMAGLNGTQTSFFGY